VPKTGQCAGTREGDGTSTATRSASLCRRWLPAPAGRWTHGYTGGGAGRMTARIRRCFIRRDVFFWTHPNRGKAMSLREGRLGARGGGGPRKMRARTRSPGRAKGTNTTHESRRPTPHPRFVSPSIVNSISSAAGQGVGAPPWTTRGWARRGSMSCYPQTYGLTIM